MPRRRERVWRAEQSPLVRRFTGATLPSAARRYRAAVKETGRPIGGDVLILFIFDFFESPNTIALNPTNPFEFSEPRCAERIFESNFAKSNDCFRTGFQFGSFIGSQGSGKFSNYQPVRSWAKCGLVRCGTNWIKRFPEWEIFQNKISQNRVFISRCLATIFDVNLRCEGASFIWVWGLKYSENAYIRSPLPLLCIARNADLNQGSYENSESY